MEYTSPLAFARLRDQLPIVSEETMEQIQTIVKINLNWEREAQNAYPRIRGRGRPGTSDRDGFGVTSVETYLYGELKTYSPETIRLLLAYTEEAEAQGRNLALENLENMVQSYGYSDLKEAEAALR